MCYSILVQNKTGFKHLPEKVFAHSHWHSNFRDNIISKFSLSYIFQNDEVNYFMDFLIFYPLRFLFTFNKLNNIFVLWEMLVNIGFILMDRMDTFVYIFFNFLKNKHFHKIFLSFIQNNCELCIQKEFWIPKR